MREITEHFAARFGPVDQVYHEVVSEYVHIDVHLIAPSADHPYRTLFTTGMSDLPMQVPEGQEDSRYAELMLHLPADWPMSQQAWTDDANYWPIRMLKFMARFPHEYGTWLCSGHTVPNGEQAEPLGEGTELGCVLLVLPLNMEDEAIGLRVNDDKVINFYQLFPLYREEMQLKLDKGMDALAERMEKVGIDGIIDPRRPNVAKRKGWLGLW